MNQVKIVEDQPSNISIKIRDPDSSLIFVNVDVSEGSILSSKSIKFDGTKSEVNKKLQSLVYIPELNSNNTVRLRVTASDGVKRSIITRNIRISPVNDAPVISLDKSNKILFKDIDSSTIEVRVKTDSVDIVPMKGLSIKRVNLETSIRGSVSKINDLFANSIKFKKTTLVTALDQNSRTSMEVKKQSLFESISKSIDERISNKDASVSKNIFSTQNHELKNYIRNEKCWAFDLDLTSISPWNSAGGQRLAGTLVSPRHIIFATHYQIPIGATIRFVTKDNVVIERKMTNKITPPYASNYFPDISVGILDIDVPSSINFAKVLPDDWDKSLDNVNVPALVLDQEEKALISEVMYMKYNVVFGRPSGKRMDFNETIIPGDSGNPSFLIINNQLVLLTIWTFPNSGTSVTAYKKEINQMMKLLGGNYELSEIDLL